MRLHLIKFMYLLFSFLTCAFFMLNTAFAEENSYIENTYTKEQIIWDFINVSFSDTQWLEETLSWKSVSVYKNDNVFKTGEAGWWTPYITRSGGLPRQNVINKWDKEISIGVDWPQYNQEDIYLAPPRPAIKGREQYYPLIMKQIASLAPEISDLTGLPVRAIDPSDPRERTEAFARIRIVPFIGGEIQNFFKDARSLPKSNPLHISNYFEYLYIAAIPFTPAARSQVEGYLLPKNDNTLGISVCKISSFVGEDLMRALISECLIRSLGLPSISKQNDKSLIGAWNKAHDSHSMREVYDGPTAFFARNAAINLSARSDNRDELPTVLRAQDFPHDLTNKNALLFNFTPYDRLMISILYCSEIKPGMDKYEVAYLLENGACSD